ncbi:MAG TPA: hypothetical protein VJ770_25740 [Stellaceae bacterium]|nr:hypothetical protein [Stellaceae bacterium]
MPAAITLSEKFRLFSDHWSPKVVARFNGHKVMVVKVKGEFVWHSHVDTDDFFSFSRTTLSSSCGRAR